MIGTLIPRVFLASWATTSETAWNMRVARRANARSTARTVRSFQAATS